MPPRIPGPSGLKSMTLCLRPAAPTSLPSTPSFMPLVQKAHLTEKQRAKARENLRQMQLDPYRWQQAQDRRNANLARRKELAAEREASWGDPVRGITTAFVESFDSAGQAAETPVRVDDEGRPLEEARPLPTSPHILNYHLTQAEVDEACAESYQLQRPDLIETSTSLLDASDLAAMGSNLAGHDNAHSKAVEAIMRITKLENGSSKDRRHANIRRIVETFGRHQTDSIVRQKGLAWNQKERIEKIRGGPDTGSSEVQIAILTAKIRVLAKMLDSKKGNKDKHNKKNLRLLCHRRQKLLAYMERKERGSGRWEHMIEKLGLTPATWKKEIEIR